MGFFCGVPVVAKLKSFGEPFIISVALNNLEAESLTALKELCEKREGNPIDVWPFPERLLTSDSCLVAKELLAASEGRKFIGHKGTVGAGGVLRNSGEVSETGWPGQARISSGLTGRQEVHPLLDHP